jgi:pimeloyl-[acyl-carrier protein] methyl ester esterase
MTIFKKVVGQGDHVVVLHGAGASHLDVMPIVRILATNYCVTNVDLPGTGESSWDDSIESIHDVADRLLPSLPEQAIYVGWSFGGLVAQSIAARYPERVKRLIGVTTTAKFIADESWLGVPQPGFGAFINPMLADGKSANDLLKLFYEDEFSHIQPKPESYQEIEKIWNGTLMISNSLLTKRIGICDATDLRELFKNLQCPVDFIMGEQDACVPKDAWSQLKNLNPITRIHPINGAKHMPFWTHPEEFTALMQLLLSNGR